MEAERLLEKGKRLLEKNTVIKLAVMGGLLGILLLSLSSLFEGGETQEKVIDNSFDAQEYEEMLEEKLCAVVTAITGEKSPKVMVTIENSGRCVYASDTRSDSKEDEEEYSAESEYVIVKNEDGSEQALTVTQLQPEVKGVVVVSELGDEPLIKEKLTMAVMTALDISSAHVCVTGVG